MCFLEPELGLADAAASLAPEPSQVHSLPVS
jgi:hypothetical protein